MITAILTILSVWCIPAFIWYLATTDSRTEGICGGYILGVICLWCLVITGGIIGDFV